MSEYTFSCYVKSKQPRLKKRKWWNLFGRDSIEMADRWNAFVVGNLSESEAELVKNNTILFMRFIGSEPKSPMLEVGKLSTPYIKTSGSKL
jgi:hypothetical protein